MPSDGPCQNKQVAARPPRQFPIHTRRLLAYMSATGTALPAMSQTPETAGKCVGEKCKIKDRVAIPRQGFLCWVGLGTVESHHSLLAEENGNLAFKASPAFPRSLAQDRLHGRMLEDFPQTRPRISSQPGCCLRHRQLVLAAPRGPQAEAKGSCPESPSQHQLLPGTDTVTADRGGHRRKHGQMSEGIDETGSLSRQRGRGPGVTAQQPGGHTGLSRVPGVAGPGTQLCPGGGCRQLPRQVKPHSRHGPAARQAAPTGAWEHQPGQPRQVSRSGGCHGKAGAGM